MAIKTSLTSLPETITYSCSDAAREFFPHRSLAWLTYGLRKGQFVTKEGVTITGSRNNPWGIVRLSLVDVRDIAISAWNTGRFTPEQLKASLEAVLAVSVKYQKEQLKIKRKAARQGSSVG